MLLGEATEKSGSLKDRLTLDVLHNLLTARGLSATAACLQQEAGLDALSLNRIRSRSPSPDRKKGNSLSDVLDSDMLSPAMEEVLRSRSNDASAAQAEQRQRIVSLTQELANQSQQMAEIRETVNRMRMSAMSEHRPTLEEQVQKLQMKMQDLRFKKNELGILEFETAERDSLSRSFRTELDLFEREVAELRRQLEERDEARMMLTKLEEEIRRMLSELNSVPLARRIQAILNDWHDHQGHLQVMVRSLFYDIDANHDGRLEWNNNEIRRFVHELFHRNGVPWPNWQDHVFYEMYRKADVDGSYSLELDESARFARICFEAALQLALTGHPEHVGDLIGQSSRTASAPIPVARSAMTYSSGVVVDFMDYAQVFQPVIVANTAHRTRMIRVIETGGHLKTTMRTYRECDKDGNGRLTWNNGEIRDFIIACFRQHGLSPPNEEQLFQMYNKFDKDRNQYLDMRECLEMVDALFRSTFIVEDPGAKIASPQQGQNVQYVRSAPPVVLVQGASAGSASARSGSSSLPVRTVMASPAKELVVGSPTQQASLFDQVDTNHDGVISRSEWDSAVAQRRVSEVQARGRSTSPQGVQIGTLLGRQSQPVPVPIQVGQTGAPSLRRSNSDSGSISVAPLLSAVSSSATGETRQISPALVSRTVSPRDQWQALSPGRTASKGVVTQTALQQVPLLSSVSGVSQVSLEGVSQTAQRIASPVGALSPSESRAGSHVSPVASPGLQVSKIALADPHMYAVNDPSVLAGSASARSVPRTLASLAATTGIRTARTTRQSRIA